LPLLNQTPKKLTGGVLAVVLCAISMGLITLWSYEGGASANASGTLHSLRGAVSTIVMPFDRASSFVGQSTDALGTLASDTTASTETLGELLAQNEELAALVMRLEEYRLENERLSALLELADVYSLEATGARILRTSIDSYNQTIIIDKGTLDGLAVGMPVMSPNGLIGQIESVGLVTSQVRLLTDPNSGVAVIIQGSRIEGVLDGSHSRLLYLNYISLDVAVKPGDAIITSGAGGIYPKGIVIGEVTSVNYAPSDVYQTIVVRPTARVKHYEEVLVLTGRPSEVSYSSHAADPAEGTENIDDAASTDEQAEPQDEPGDAASQVGDEQ